MPGKISSFIHSIACVTPHTLIAQADAAKHLAARNGVPEDSLARLFRMAGVETRQTVLSSLDQLYSPQRTAAPSTAERMEIFERSAAALAIAAARKALDDARLNPTSITHLITVSCTGFYAPGFEHAIIQTLELPTTVVRTHIGFMGCHAALNALGVADSFSRSCDGVVLIVCVELCSLHLQYSDQTDLLVANSLFADGAAALVCSAKNELGARFKILSLYSDIITASADLMSWRIRDQGFEMTLSTRLPEMLRGQLPNILNAWSQQSAWNAQEITAWVVHPGGPRLLSACEEVLGDLSDSREVLRQHGNMSSATVLFILDKLAQTSGDYGVIAFGPGVSFEGALVRRL